MTLVVTRKNEVIFSGVFVAADGSGAQPTNAEAVVAYKSLSGDERTATITLTNTAGTWTGVWDTSDAEPGNVDYTVRCWGGVVAAQDGKITLKANRSNMTIA
jgi:hypothetical protein